MASWNGNIGNANWAGSYNNNNNSPNVKISSIQVNYISSGLIQSGILSTLNLNVSSINCSNIDLYNSSNWSKYPAIQDVNIANHNINNITTTNTNAIVVGNGGQLWNGNAQFNGTGNLFSPYWYNFTMDANITTGQQNQQYPPTNQQYFSQYDITHNSFDAQSVFSNLTFNNAHLGINSQGLAVLPVGNVILESKNYRLNLPYVNPPISLLAGSYRGSAYLGVNGTGPSAYIRMNYDSIGNYIPNNSALVEINADSVIGVTPLASSRVRTTAGKCDMIGTYGATMTAGTFINPVDPDLNTNYRATAELKLYGYSIIGIPEPITGNAGTATLTVTGSNRLTGDTYGNSVITINATRATTNTLGYNATVNINADDHIYLNTYRTHLNGNENYIGNKLIGFNSLDITNVNSIQVSNILNDRKINILSDLDLSNNNIYNVNNLTASNINTSTLKTSSITTTVEFFNNDIVSFSNYTYLNYFTPYVSTIKPLNMTFDNTDTYTFVGYDNIYTLNLYSVSFTDSHNAIGIIPNTLVNGTCLSNQLTSAFFSNPIGDILTLQFTLSGLSLPVSYVINNEYSDISIYIPLADYFLSPYSNITVNIDAFSNFSFTYATTTKTVSSFYKNLTYITQNLSSAFLNVDISGYDINNNKFHALGDLKINSSKFLTDKIYTNFISAGTISGGIPFSNDNITVNSISTNRISTNILQTGFLQFTNFGGSGLFNSANPYRGSGVLLNLSNSDFSLSQQNLLKVNVGDIDTVSTNSGIIRFGTISSLVGNTINVSSISTQKLAVSQIENLSSLVCGSISTNTLAVSQIENLSSLVCGSISTNTLAVSQLENVSSITCGNISTNSLSVYQIESVSSLTAPRISSFNIVSRTGYYTGFVSTAVGYHDAITTGYITGSNGTLNYSSESIFPNRATANIGYQIANNNSGCWNNFNGLNANLSSINATSGNPLSTIGINGYLKGDNFITKLLSSVTISTATITGLGAYFSSISAGVIVGGIDITSTITGLGTLGYVSSSQLTSTVRGLGTAGYVSSSQLTSTVRGLGQIYLSSIEGSIQSDITSSITGLGTLGYVSSSQLTSTVRGLGNIYVSTPSLVSTIVGWAGIPANKNVNLYGNNILNVNNLFTDVISPSHSDYVLFNGNGIQTNNITSADFTQINFNNDINLEQHYNLKDALSLQISDGSNHIIMCNDAADGGVAKFYTTQNSFFFTTSNGNSAVIQLDYNGISDTYFSNDISGYFHLSNTTNTLILEGLVKIDTITSYINPNVSFQQPILVDTISGFSNPYISFTNPIFVDFINPYTLDAIVTFPNGIQVDNFYSISPGLVINFNNNVFFGGHDLSGANKFSFIGTKPIYSSGSSGTDNDIIFQNSIDMSNNSIINLFGVYTDYIDANSNSQIFISKPINLNNSNIQNVATIQVDYIKPNSNSLIDFVGNELSNISKIDFNVSGGSYPGALGIASNPHRTGSILYLSNSDWTFSSQNVYDLINIYGTNTYLSYNDRYLAFKDETIKYILNSNFTTTKTIHHTNSNVIYFSNVSLTAGTYNFQYCLTNIVHNTNSFYITTTITSTGGLTILNTSNDGSVVIPAYLGQSGICQVPSTSNYNINIDVVSQNAGNTVSIDSGTAVFSKLPI